jgi:ubiquitin-protein ligase
MDSLKNRIMKEYEDLQKFKKENQIEVWLIDDNLKHWKGKIKGPVYSSYIIYRWTLRMMEVNSSLIS